MTDCGESCGECWDCLTRLPPDMVLLMNASRGTVPEVYETAVACAVMLLRNPPVMSRARRRAS